MQGIHFYYILQKIGGILCVYSTKRTRKKFPHNPPASLVRKHAPAQAAVPGYCQEASASARSQSLGYTMESAGTLPRMPVQRVPDPEPDSVKRDFFTSLTQIIQGHIHAAAPTPQIGPPNNALWNSIKQDFGTENNIDILLNTMDPSMLKNIDLHSVESLIAFSSLLGLADLHVENAVYSQAPKHAMQLIDAEIGMKYILDSADKLPLLMTAMHKGEMLYPAPSIDRASIASEDFEIYNPDILSDFLNTARQKLEGKKSRIVLLATPRLFIYRSQYLAGFDDWYVSDGHTYNQELSEKVSQYYNGILVPILMQKSDICQRYAEKDFAAGRIPFFELHYSTGKIWQVLPGEEIPIATYVTPDGVPFLNFMIQSRADALAQEFLEIQERKKEQRNKKIMAGVGMTAIAAIVGGAGLYYWFHKR